jgi:membrane protease YdiL (CAAX protease family)
MKTSKELTIFILFLSLIILAEIMTSFVDPNYGLFIHSILLFSMMALSAFWQKTRHSSNLFLCLSIAPLIRIFSLSLPLSYFPTYAWYIIAGIPMLLAAIIVIKIQALNLKDVGITLKRPGIQLLIMLTGIPFGILEYLILQPSPIATGLSVLQLVFLAIALILATGFVEELVFRGVFQNSAIKLFGAKTGLIAVSAVFAVLHIGWLNVLDIVLVFFIGLFFWVLMYKTGSLAGVSLSHGLTNVFLFLVMPSVNLISALVPK